MGIWWARPSLAVMRMNSGMISRAPRWSHAAHRARKASTRHEETCWSPGSRLYATIDGQELDTLRTRPGMGAFASFREAWAIDATDGRVEMTRRCEQPGALSVRWDGTACADTTMLNR